MKVKLATRGLAGPETKVVGGGSVVSGDGHIVGYSLNNLTSFPDCDCLAVGVGGLVNLPEELDLYRLVSRPVVAFGDMGSLRRP